LKGVTSPGIHSPFATILYLIRELTLPELARV
jgi:hypothetical protein